MSTDWKALCEELIALVERCPVTSDTDWIAERNELIVWFHSIRRAALATEADGQASVVGEPGDENCWEWYTYCPEEGLEMYSEREQAQSAAQSIMGSYEVAAYSDGWHEDMESVSWGMLVPVEQAQVVERKTAEPGGEFDEWVKYELRPARYGHQPTPPAEGEVGAVVADLRMMASQAAEACQFTDAENLSRAADLLEQRHPTPVPVAERLPGPEDCDGEGLCWVWNRTAYTWGLFRLDLTAHSHWLPATALPMPQGEVQS